MHSNYGKKEVVHLSKYPFCWVNKLVVNVVSRKKISTFLHFCPDKWADVSNSNYLHENRVMHDLNLQLAKICILHLAKFFIIKVFKNSEVTRWESDAGNKLTSVCELLEITWPEYWPLIGQDRSRDLNTGLLLVNSGHVNDNAIDVSQIQAWPNVRCKSS